MAYEIEFSLFCHTLAWLLPDLLNQKIKNRIWPSEVLNVLIKQHFMPKCKESQEEKQNQSAKVYKGFSKTLRELISKNGYIVEQWWTFTGGKNDSYQNKSALMAYSGVTKECRQTCKEQLRSAFIQFAHWSIFTCNISVFVRICRKRKQRSERGQIRFSLHRVHAAFAFEVIW